MARTSLGPAFSLPRISSLPPLIGTLTFVVLSSLSTVAEMSDVSMIEAFTSQDLPITSKHHDASRAIAKQMVVYEIDGIERLERFLSQRLPNDAEAAKRMALIRIAELDEARMSAVEQGALGLSKAAQYGLDRYPAIVFDGEAVVYGITELEQAVHLYQAWREGETP